MARDYESATRGQRIVTETGPDRSTDKADREALHGRKMSGGVDDLSHSLEPGRYGKMPPKPRK